MLNDAAKLNPRLFDADVEQAPTRDGFGNGVVEAGKKDEAEKFLKEIRAAGSKVTEEYA